MRELPHVRMGSLLYWVGFTLTKGFPVIFEQGLDEQALGTSTLRQI